MPSRHSEATMRVVAGLRSRGHEVGCRAVERWAEQGLAPRPRRQSLGRGRGFTSEYPAGALEQYCAVASVMRRGLDWRTSGLMLIGRGGLPAREATFRQLLAYLFSVQDASPPDPLEYAEQAVAAAASDPLFRRMERAMKKNMSTVAIIDPATNTRISPEAAVQGAMTRVLAGAFGEPLPPEAAEEVAAAVGLLEQGISDDEYGRRLDYTKAAYEELFTFAALSTVAVSPSRLQAAVREARQAVVDRPTELFEVLPCVWQDVFMVILGLAFVLVEDLGGPEWLDRVSTADTTRQG